MSKHYQKQPLPQYLVERNEKDKKDVIVRKAFCTSTGYLEWEAFPFTVNE